MELTGAAKVTKCNHYFHGKCLRKWLYVQDSCPLCYGALYNDKETNESRSNVQLNNAQVIPHNGANEGLIDNDHAMERPIIDDGEENDSHNSENDCEDFDVGSTGDVEELVEDIETSENESDGSRENNDASVSGSDEDDLLYDSMDSKTNSLSRNVPTFHQIRNGSETLTTNQPSEGDILQCVSKTQVKPSQLSDTETKNDGINKLESVQKVHSLSVVTNKNNNSFVKESKESNSDKNS